MDKRGTLSKDKIVRAAFAEWGTTKFCRTSLSTLADRLNITKPALYRHFKNKDDLVNSMEKEFKDQLAAVRAAFFAERDQDDLDSLVRHFFQAYIPLFLKKPFLFHFLFHLSVQKMKQTGNEPDYFRQESSLFRQSIQASCPDMDKRLAELIIRFLYTTGASQLLNTMENNAVITEKTIQKVIEQCVEIVLTGIYGGSADSMPSPVLILEACSLPKSKKTDGGKLYSAIARVVAKEGLAGATTDKIAEEIGITKSSLYFHFKNRQDMLNEMILDDQQKFMELFRQRTRFYSKIEEKIICYMGMVGIWLLHDPTLLTVYTWLWFQRMELHLNPPENAIQDEIYALFRTAIDGGQIKALGITEKQLAEFLTRLVGQEVQVAVREGSSSSYPVSELAHIIDLLFRGIHHFTHGGKQ